MCGCPTLWESPLNKYSNIQLFILSGFGHIEVGPIPHNYNLILADDKKCRPFIARSSNRSRIAAFHAADPGSSPGRVTQTVKCLFTSFSLAGHPVKNCLLYISRGRAVR